MRGGEGWEDDWRGEDSDVCDSTGIIGWRVGVEGERERGRENKEGEKTRE